MFNKKYITQVHQKAVQLQLISDESGNIFTKAFPTVNAGMFAR